LDFSPFGNGRSAPFFEHEGEVCASFTLKPRRPHLSPRYEYLEIGERRLDWPGWLVFDDETNHPEELHLTRDWELREGWLCVPNYLARIAEALRSSLGGKVVYFYLPNSGHDCYPKCEIVVSGIMASVDEPTSWLMAAAKKLQAAASIRGDFDLLTKEGIENRQLGLDRLEAVKRIFRVPPERYRYTPK